MSKTFVMIQVRLSPEEREKIAKQMSRENHRSMSSFSRKILLDYCEEAENRE